MVVRGPPVPTFFALAGEVFEPDLTPVNAPPPGALPLDADDDPELPPGLTEPELEPVDGDLLDPDEPDEPPPEPTEPDSERSERGLT